MKIISYLFFVGILALSLSSCKKKKTPFRSAEKLPVQLNYLKGTWQVIDFTNHNGWGTPASVSYFDEMVVSQEYLWLFKGGI